MLSLLFACATATDPTDTATAGDTADSGAAGPVVTWYTGTSDGQTPDGSYVQPTEGLLFIRTLDATAGTITEEVWSEGKPTWSHDVLVHAVDADAGTFTSTWVTEDGTLGIVGAFDAGEPWAWTAWHSTSTYSDGDYLGTRIDSADTVDDAGAVHTTKSMFDADGKDLWDMVELLTPTTEDAFNAALAEIKVE